MQHKLQNTAGSAHHKTSGRLIVMNAVPDPLADLE
jgi:hypothetical protein